MGVATMLAAQCQLLTCFVPIAPTTGCYEAAETPLAQDGLGVGPSSLSWETFSRRMVAALPRVRVGAWHAGRGLHRPETLGSSGTP